MVLNFAIKANRNLEFALCGMENGLIRVYNKSIKGVIRLYLKIKEGATMTTMGKALQEAFENNPGAVKQFEYDKNKYNVVSVTAFLVGVDEHFFKDEGGLLISEFKKLSDNRNAVIMRNLCILRTAFAKNFVPILTQMQQHYKGVNTIEEIPKSVFGILSQRGVIIKNYNEPLSYIIELNKLISDRINNCKSLYPDWINWDYVKDIFVIPDGHDKDKAKESSKDYAANRNNYPYQCYINWFPDESEGNILYADNKFVDLLYKANGDEFTDWSKVSDIGYQATARLDDFLRIGEKITIVIDGENADPYKLCAMLDSLTDEQFEKISKIIVFDDTNASSFWEKIEKYTEGIPVEYHLVERLLEGKSQVDMKLGVEVTKEHLTNSVDSIILLSSDSDYWALIESLPSARFLVMVERDQVSSKLKFALKEKGTPFCTIDDYYSGEINGIKYEAMLNDIKEYVTENMNLNMYSMLEYAMKSSRVELNESEQKEFVNQYLKTVKLVFDDDGQLKLEFKKINKL